ncbi:hypothetical protein M433DRAFT_488079 [Acidomyces richmondensis BFW]|nr:MAG: hypothetical protein FE78DRAFT_285509 [Acidomyces sp. 'richmondensis']KYG47605.1 hypothetical protein M433DRAFT_488079 [Acidomyces richmondensis BFW]
MLYTVTYISVTLTLHLVSLYALAELRSQSPPYLFKREPNTLVTIKRFLRILSILVVSLTLFAPYLIRYHILQSALRVVCFFWACKLLDLCEVRVDKPPTRLVDVAGEGGKRYPLSEPAPMSSRRDKMLYAWLLFTEMRYHSFDIAVTQPHRPSLSKQVKMEDNIKSYGPLILIPILVFLFPTAETKAALLLLIIQFGLECAHTILHWKCPHHVFYQPFIATSISEFWTTHWQGCASAWLRSLAYSPVMKLIAPSFGPGVGRAAAIIATFSLSGLWHAWAVACVADDSWSWTLGFQVWAWFVSQGVACLLEQWMCEANNRGIIRWAVAWSYSLLGIGIAIRTLERHSKGGWYQELVGEFTARGRTLVFGI